MRAYIFQACKNIALGGAIDDVQENKILTYIQTISKGHATTTIQDTDYSKYQPNFAWAPVDRIKATFKNTTQLAIESSKWPL